MRLFKIYISFKHQPMICCHCSAVAAGCHSELYVDPDILRDTLKRSKFLGFNLVITGIPQCRSRMSFQPLDYHSPFLIYYLSDLTLLLLIPRQKSKLLRLQSWQSALGVGLTSKNSCTKLQYCTNQNGFPLLINTLTQDQMTMYTHQLSSVPFPERPKPSHYRVSLRQGYHPAY